MNKIDIKCPNCNKKIRTKIYNEINNDYIFKIIDDSLFKVVCSNCNKEIRIDYPLKLETDNYIITYNINDIKTNKKLRITDTYNDFREKVMIFNDNLNDILIEYLKNYIYHNLELEDKEIRYNNMTEENIVFSIIGDKTVGINIKFYEDLLKKAKLKKSNIVNSNNYNKYIKL